MRLAAARVERGDLRRVRGPFTTRGHPVDDLLTTLGELVDDRARHALDVGCAARHGTPLEPEPEVELFAQRGLVEVAGRLLLGVEVPRVQRRPPLVGPFRQVRGDNVGVQQRITGPAGPVDEARLDEAVALDLNGTTLPSARAAGLALEVVHRLVDGGVVAGPDLGCHPLVADGPENADGLRCAEGQVEAGDRAVGDLAVTGAAEDELQLLGGDLAFEAELCRPVAGPRAAALALAAVVAGPVRSDLIGVVRARRRAGVDLADRQHERSVLVLVDEPVLDLPAQEDPPPAALARRDPLAAGPLLDRLLLRVDQDRDLLGAHDLIARDPPVVRPRAPVEPAGSSLAVALLAAPRPVVAVSHPMVL